MKKTILLVDDQREVLLGIREFLSEMQMTDAEILMAQDGRQGLALALERRPNVIVADIMMPELDGFSACREIRKTSQVPMLMLSARGEEYDKLTGFDCGADDYKVKPFSPCELMASIRVIVSRHGMQQAPMAFSGLVIDPAGRTVTADGMRLALTARNTICSSIWP